MSEELNEAVEALNDYFGEEDLDEELAACIEEDGERWVMLRHPLVFSIPYMPQMNKMLNAQLRQKQEHLDRSYDKGDWHTYIWLHERPYRLDAFLEVMHMMRPDEYWSLLSSIWVDSENIRQNAGTWEALLANDVDERQAFMADNERMALAALPDTIDIFQGHTLDRDDGWSWTTNEETAVWFARRFGMLEDATPVVTVATVQREDVFAFLLGRNEHEILVDPLDVTHVRHYAPGEQE